VNRIELIDELRDKELIGGQQTVVIRTDKQLLPNANYVFQVEQPDDYTIVLRPTMRRVES
jgi:hypothetical protein